jgi:catechol 2,3-dioxygenase-like lactoylglutathione lyase family enzyme
VAVLNHHIVGARDANTTALFFSEVLGLDPPTRLGPFAVVHVSGDTTLDFVDDDHVHPRHYAFLVTEQEFDEIFERVKVRCGRWWADPSRHERGQINYWDDGRGVYFDDPNGHLLEILTRPYGSGGTEARHPHPLILPTIEPPTDAGGAPPAG